MEEANEVKSFVGWKMESFPPLLGRVAPWPPACLRGKQRPLGEGECAPGMPAGGFCLQIKASV